MFAVFHHAPLTGVAVYASAAMTLMFGNSYAAVPRGFFSLLYHFGFFPIGYLPGNMADALCIIVLLFHLRVLERHFGTARFFTFGFMPWLIGVLMFPFAMPDIPAAAFSKRIPLWMWAPSLSALSFKYFKDVPSLGSTKIFGPIAITDKAFFYFLLGKLFLFPWTDAHSSKLANISRGSLHCSLTMAAIGIAVSLVMSPTYSLFRENGSFIRGFKKLLVPFFGGIAEVRHAHLVPTGLPPENEEQDAGEMYEQMQMAQMAADAANGNGGAGAPPAVRQIDIDTIMGLGLHGLTRDQAVGALKACNGDVEAAVSMLLQSD